MSTASVSRSPSTLSETWETPQTIMRGGVYILRFVVPSTFSQKVSSSTSSVNNTSSHLKRSQTPFLRSRNHKRRSSPRVCRIAMEEAVQTREGAEVGSTSRANMEAADDPLAAQTTARVARNFCTAHPFLRAADKNTSTSLEVSTTSCMTNCISNTRCWRCSRIPCAHS